jgi:hypothetical protein
MSVAISMPDDIQAALERAWGALARHVQESLAIDGYGGLAEARSKGWRDALKLIV